MAPAFVLLLGSWAWEARHAPRARRWLGLLRSSAWLAAMTAACAVPLWVVISTFLSNDSGLFSSGQTAATKLGNLLGH